MQPFADLVAKLPMALQVFFGACGLVFGVAGASTVFADLRPMIGRLQARLSAPWLLFVAFILGVLGGGPSVLKPWTAANRAIAPPSNGDIVIAVGFAVVLALVVGLWLWALFAKAQGTPLPEGEPNGEKPKGSYDDLLERHERLQLDHDGCPARVTALQSRISALESGPCVYEDQEAMLEAGWGIKEVLQDADVLHVSLALGTGHHFNDLPDELIKRRVKRMVLSKPNANLLSGIYRHNLDRLEYAISNIHRAYEKAKGNGVDVKVSDTLSLQGLLVSKKDGSQDWARIQAPLPPSDADQWPSIVIRRKDQPALFVRVEAAFNALHGAGESLAAEAKPKQATESEKAAIDLLRIPYRSTGARAVRLVLTMLELIERELRESQPTARLLLETYVPHVRKVDEDVATALADTATPIHKVQEAFADLVREYTCGCSWVNLLARDPNVSSDILAHWDEWQPLHDEFRKDVIKASKSAVLSNLSSSFEMPGSWATRWAFDDKSFPDCKRC